jgi:signal transduction histidine kinase
VGGGHTLSAVDVAQRLARRIETGANLALALLMAAALAFDAARAARVNGQWPYVAAFGTVVCAVALVRARHRAWAVVTGLAAFALAAVISSLWSVPPGQLQIAPLIGLVVLAASQARWLPARPAVLITAVGTVVVAAAESSHAGGSFNPRALFALFGATVWAGAAGFGVWLRYLDHRRESALESVRREERLELARELHDVVAHHVTGMVVQAQAARFAGPDHPASAESALASIESAGAETLTAIRRLVGLLRDPGDAAGAGCASEPIDQLVRRFGRHGPTVDLHLPDGLAGAAWPPEIVSTVYRIVQESLTNVARHAPAARSVAVTVTQDRHQVTVEVTDDAPPAAARPARVPTGYGLIGMRERVEALGGRLQAGPLASAGWAVRASLPFSVRTGP